MHYGTYPINGRQSVFTVVVLIAVALGIVGAVGVQPDKPKLADQNAVLCSLEDSFSAIAEQVEPGVVGIVAVQHPQETDARNTGIEELFKRFFEGKSEKSYGISPGQFLYPIQETQSPVTASGSGTIVRREGQNFYILTNYHVVEGAYTVSVTLEDGTELKGTVTGTDPVTDLAVVRMISPKLTDANVVPMGDSDTVEVGSWALAVGNPFGFEHTLTVGIVSALKRALEEGDTSYPNLIQTDAAINRGNSGGPLVNVEGQVIGVNAAIASPTGGFVGLGFAIPINTAKAVLDDLIRDGRVVRGWLGVGSQELIPEFQEYYNVKAGVLIASVADGSPAKEAGIAEEDVIVKVGEATISDVVQLQRLVAAMKPGTSTSVTVIRQGVERMLQAKIGLSPRTPAGRPQPVPVTEGPGIEVRTLTSDLAERIGQKGLEGVIVIDIAAGSPAEGGGLEEGDIVTNVNGREVRDEARFASMLKNISPGKVVVLRIVRNNSPRMIGFRVESGQP